MNEKLRGILQTAWTEPRHFLFWLAMLGLCASITSAALAGVAGPNLFLAGVALVGILCFLLGFLGFILAWIPLVRHAFARMLRRRFLSLVCVLTLIALFYAVEDWRGATAWRNFKRDREARGERFDLASIIPAPVPANENFFETPLWTDLHSIETNRSGTWAGGPSDKRVIFSIFGPASGNAPSTGNWNKPQPVDLAAWQAYYRSTNNVFPALNGPPTNYFPTAREPQSPAADVLLGLSRFDENRKLLVEAAARPQARFWINYDAGFAMLLPHLARMKATSQYLALHANAARLAGDHAAALEDFKLQLRLIDTLHREPIFITHLVRIAMLEISIGPVWEGIAARQWTEPELAQIEEALGKLDFLADYQFAIRGDRTCDLWAVDFIHERGLVGLDELSGETASRPKEPAELGRFVARVLFQFVPSGWFVQNKLSLCRLYEDCLFPIVDVQHRVVSPPAVDKSQAALARLRPRPYDAISRMLLPGLSRAGMRFARVQSALDRARVACALERCRLAKGQFPDSLDSLAPQFIPSLPHDVINGEPLKYRRTDDGGFLLYSVGWNETDDGGTVALTKSGSPDATKGDWVWRTPGK